jgi:hypothetical protein
MTTAFIQTAYHHHHSVHSFPRAPIPYTSDEPPQNRQLSVHDTARRRTDTDVVPQYDELDIEDLALSDSADGDACAVLVVAVEAGLERKV